MFELFTDFLLDHWPEIFVFDFLRYVIPASLLTILTSLFARRLVHRRIQSRRATSKDRAREFRYSLSTIFIFSLVGLTIAVGETLGWMDIESGPASPLWLIANLALIIFLHDAYFYWAHRLMHHKWLFARVHRTHHLSRTPTPWAAYSFAPAEALIEAAFLPLYLLLVPTHVVVIGVFLIHMVLRNVIAHAGFELFPKRWMSIPLLRHLTVTLHHDMHHEHFTSNYGFYFTWWDRWMGTEHPEYRARFKTLTEPEAAPKSSRTGSLVKSGSQLLLVCAVSLALMQPLPVHAQSACDLSGYWVTEGFGAVVEIQQDSTGASLSGTTRWIYDQEEQQAVGINLFSEFVQDRCDWRDGLILNPQNGRHYRSAIARRADGTLRVRGCFGPFCQTQTWRPYRQVLESLPPGKEPLS